MSGMSKVVWAEGIFLGQQHFQAWDRQLNERIGFAMQAHLPFYWGVSVLEWSETALREGRFELNRLKCVLPNGQAIDFNREQEDPVFFDLASSGREECVVSLAVPNNGVVAGVAGYQSDSRIASWIAQYKDLSDDCDSARTREVLLAKPNIMLRIERDTAERMQSLRLVKIQRQYDGEYKVVNDIFPPCLNINAITSLRDVVQSSVDMLTNLVREFAKNRLKIGDVSSYSTNELTEFLFNKELALLLPEMQQYIQQPNLHPYGYYQLLTRIHQVVSVYIHPEAIGRVVEYKHDALEECLTPLLNDVRNMLLSRKERPEDQVALNYLSPGRYETTEVPRHALENFSFYLAVDCKQDSVEWVNQFTGLCKLASIDQLDAIVASGLPGVPIKHVQRLPQKIRIKSGYEYFRILTDNELWNAVVLSQKFGMFCMGEFADAKIELIMLEEK